MVKRRYWLEPAIWLLLWIVYVPVTRPWQASWLLAALAMTVLLGLSSAVLHASAGRGAASRLVVAVAAGCVAAVVIRLGYIALAPTATPLGWTANILIDSLWIGIHATLVGWFLRWARR